jgi:glucoamylase
LSAPRSRTARLPLLAAACALALGAPAWALPQSSSAERVELRTRVAGPRWLAKPGSQAWQRLGRGIQKEGVHGGAVIAAPDGNPEYQFHWVRDAAIAMNEVGLRAMEHDRGPVRDALVGKLKRYIAFSLRASGTDSPAGRGEPKYHLDGRPYVDPWGRPQNDGPSLRTLKLLAFADWSLRHDDADYVKKNLYNADAAHAEGQLLKADLDYLVENHAKPSYDIWEEVLGYHFYTRAVQVAALARGARVAEQLGDTDRAARYRTTAAGLRRALDEHWDARYGLIRATMDQKGGIEHKWTGLDSAVILAAIHTYGQDSPIDILDGKLMSTAALLEVDFRNKYKVNKRGMLAFLAGRYPEDRYTGQPHKDRDEGGNPWVVTTNGFAEYYYRVAGELAKAPYFKITAENRAFVLAALGEEPDSQGLAGKVSRLVRRVFRGNELPVGTHLVAGDKRLDAIVAAVFKKGDAFLRTVQDRVGEGPQNEQIDRTTGAGVGAVELTWNYASLLSAKRARREALAHLTSR